MWLLSGGHVPGRKRTGDRPCPHRKRRRGMRLFLRPCLLLMLSQADDHGYSLFDQLQAYGFDPQRLDSSIVYRDLREMEHLGLIDSYWDEESLGPRRRVYRIRSEGMDCLAEWVDDLEKIRDQMGRLIDEYRRLIDVQPSG